MPASLSSVLSISELASAIFDYLEAQDIYHLLYTSKITFYASIPSVWKHTPKVIPLLTLLPCAAEVESSRLVEEPPNTYNWYPRTVKFTFHRPLVVTNFSRFNIYAPHITHLDFSLDRKTNVVISGWQYLLDHVNSGHALLPNLAELTLQTRIGGISPYSAIMALATSSLLRLHLKDYLNLSKQSSDAILDYIARMCPNLTSFELHLDPTVQLELEESAPPSGSGILAEGWGEQLARLTRLSTNANFLREQFQDISRLRVLEQLVIYWHKEDRFIPFPLPDDAFLHLRKISLNIFEAADTNALWEIGAITKNLIDVELVLNPYSPGTGRQPSFDCIPATIFKMASANMKIAVFQINCELIRPSVVLIKKDWLESMSQLSLRVLCITCAYGTVSPLELSRLFPQLERLCWPELNVHLYELHHFAQVSQLQHLRVKIWSETPSKFFVPHPLPTLTGPKNLTPITIEMGALPPKYGPERYFVFADHISYIWPNVRLEVDRFGERDGQTRKYFKIANAYIQLLEVEGRGDWTARRELWQSLGDL